MSNARGLICRILNIIPALGLILKKEYYKNILVVENGAHRLRLKSANDTRRSTPPKVPPNVPFAGTFRIKIVD